MDEIPQVCFIEDLVRILGTSRATIDRRRKYGVFPIPELDSIDKRPRWGRADVQRYLDRQPIDRKLRRVG